jgi:hypothetical protein
MADEADPRDAKFIPTKSVPDTTSTANEATGNHHTVVQTGNVGGGVHLYASAGPAEPDLVSGGPTPDELAAAGEFFVPRGGFEEAEWRLKRFGAVLLEGNGTGWFIAAVRLLQQVGAKAVAQLNPPRHLNDERAKALKAEVGYVWSARQSFEEFQFDDIRRAVEKAGGWLVVLVHHSKEVPHALSDRLVRLDAPDPMDVARARVCAEGGPHEDERLRVLEKTFGHVLRPGTSPRKAARAAELAIRQAAGELDEDDAVRQFDEELSSAVRRWFDTERWLTEYVAMVAVSVLEDLPADRVFAEAEKLEQAIREAELPADRKPRPRRVFQFSRNELLTTIDATVKRREHPLYTGLTEETVRFARHDWAPALLCHAWVQYPALQPILADWLVRTSFLKGVAALCTVVLGVPASDPLHFVREFAGNPSVNKRIFAAATLSQLTTHHDRRELVAETLDRWIERDVGVWRKTTAAMVYGLAYGIRSPKESLRQLERLGRTGSPQQQNWVVWAVCQLYGRPANQVTVLQAMCRWVYVADRTEGLRTIALSVGWQLVGIDPDPEFDFPPPEEADRLTVRRLMVAMFWHVLRDDVFGARMLQLMLEQAQNARFDPKARARLTALMDMVLDGGGRRLAIRRLVEHHPRHRRRIRRLFRLFRLLAGRPWWAVVAGWGHGSRRAGEAAGS